MSHKGKSPQNYQKPRKKHEGKNVEGKCDVVAVAVIVFPVVVRNVGCLLVKTGDDVEDVSESLDISCTRTIGLTFAVGLDLKCLFCHLTFFMVVSSRNKYKYFTDM